VADDDALAALIVDLADLRREVEDLRGVKDQLTAVAAAVASIRRQLEQLAEEADAVRPRIVWWPDLDAGEAETAWAALAAWVADVLVERYSEAARVLYPCWHQHPEAVDAVTALHATWRAAYQNTSAPVTEAATWLDRWLPALLGQVRVALRSCERYGHAARTTSASNGAPV
jgi:hypothetical protein